MSIHTSIKFLMCVDYLDLRDGETLAALDAVTSGARLFVAAELGGIRLIDNISAG